MKRKIYHEAGNNTTLRVCLVEKIKGDRVLVEEEFGMNLHETSMKALTITNEYERVNKPKNQGFVRRIREAEPTEEQDWYYNND